jgi:hypothetical protein
VASNVTFSVTAIGSLTLSYQWLFNSTTIPGATGTALTLTNLQMDQGGLYAVLVSNDCGVITSSAATLTVLWPPPTILSPPQSQTAELGDTVTLSANTVGEPPLTYLWLFNLTNIVATAAGTPHLQLSNVQLSQSGAYNIVLTNSTGSVTSSAGMLGVIPAVQRRPAADLTLMGNFGVVLNLEYAPVLNPPIGWIPLATVTMTNYVQTFIDAASPEASQRYYRASWNHFTTNTMILGLRMVPAITLTGISGQSVRLDYINQFGPVDAWVTLDTIHMTNSSQLYFDTSLIGQPPRLYRVVPSP